MRLGSSAGFPYYVPRLRCLQVHRPHPPPAIRAYIRGEEGAAPEGAQAFQKVREGLQMSRGWQGRAKGKGQQRVALHANNLDLCPAVCP